MTKPSDRVLTRTEGDDRVTVVTQRVRVNDYRQSVRVSLDGELVKVEVGYLENLHFTTPYEGLSVSPAQARHLAGLLLQVAGEAEGIDFAPEDLARYWLGWSRGEIDAKRLDGADD